MIYAQPGKDGSVVSYKTRYENYIGGEWVAPVKGQYFDNITPVNGEVICKIPRSTEEDIDLALDAAHKAAPAWSRTWKCWRWRKPGTTARPSGKP
mgnify:CR=1 FL=1